MKSVETLLREIGKRNTGYAENLLNARREWLVQTYRDMTPEQQTEAREEMAELLDGSDTAMLTQSREAGFDTFGPM